MYVANFICDDPNGEDGIYGSEWNSIGAHRFASIAEALQAIADDADSHAAMYADTAERHWHGAFCDAAAYFHTADALHHVTAMTPALRNGYAYSVEGDGSNSDGEPWRLGEYRITPAADAPHVTRTESGATINLNNGQCELLRSVCDFIRQDDDDDAERQAMATLCGDLYTLLRTTVEDPADCAYCDGTGGTGNVICGHCTD
jgi:hypothetical protein